MTTYAITTAVNIDSLATKTGGDTYNINGGTLTIDQDTRFGLNQSSVAAMGTITLSATLGGELIIDGRYVRLIPYNSGTGNVPASNTAITQGSASGLLICVMSSLTAAPTAAGAAMPASGFIKVKAWNSVAYAAGALTGIGANATGADTVGWIDVAGREAQGITIPRLGKWTVRGEWYPLGSTTGARSGTYQIPTSGLSQWHGGVFVETSAASGVYEFYPNAGSTVTALAANFATDFRGKVCWISTAGVVRFGHDGTNSTGGYLPEAGCAVRMGNVFLQNALLADGTPVIPNSAVTSRYETLTSSAGVIDIDKASISWYLNCLQPYSVNLSNVALMDSVLVAEVASPMIWSQVGVGQLSNIVNFGLSMSLCFAGGTFTDCTFTSYSLAASGRYVTTMTDIAGFTFERLRVQAYVFRANATTGAMTLLRANDCAFIDSTVGTGRALMTTCVGVTWTNTAYFDHPAIHTNASMPMATFDLAGSCQRIMIDGIHLGGITMCGPYNALLNVGAAGCSDIDLRNVGTYASPLSLGAPRLDNQAWTRSAAVATVTSTAHGFEVNDTIYVVVSSDTGAISVAQKTITTVPTADTFTFACTNAASTSGTVCYFGVRTGSVFTLAAGAAANQVRVKRVYAPHTRANLYTMDNSSKNVTLENVFSEYINIPVMVGLNMFNKNVSGTPTLAVQTAVYGTHWWNGYICGVASTTASCAWTRSGTTVTVTAPGHSLRTTAASTSTVAQNIPVSVTASSATGPVPLGVYNIVTAVDADTFRITGVNTGATSGTLDYRVGNGRVGVVMNESTAETDGQYEFTAGNPKFTSAGTLYMPTIGDQAVFTTPDYILGQGASFPIMELQIGGSTLTRYDFAYQLDINDGAGFGGWHNLYYERAGGSGSAAASTFTVTNATGVEIGDYVWGTGIAPNAKVTGVASNTVTVDTANTATVSGIIRFNHLPSETGMDQELGIKFKWRITTTTTNTVGIIFLYIFAESTDTGRAYQYPLGQNTVTFTGLPTGADAVVLDAGTSTIFDQVDANAGTSYVYTYSGAQTVDVGFLKEGYVPYYIRGLALVEADSSVPVSLSPDRNFI